MQRHAGISIVLIGLATGVLATPVRADLGVPITPPRGVSVNDGPEEVANQRPSIATDGQGLWIAAWGSSATLNMVTSDFDILLARSVDSGEHWSVPAPLSPDAAIDNRRDADVRIATDRQGHWVAVWVSAAANARNDVFASRSIDNGASWSSPIALNTNPPTSVTAHSGNESPVIVTDGQGLWIAVWVVVVDILNSNDIPVGAYGNIYRSLSTDNGANWTLPAPVNNDVVGNSKLYTLPRIAGDGQGHWIVVWQGAATYDSPPDSRFARSLDNGATWDGPRFLDPNGPDPDADYDPEIVTDGPGHWLAVWNSYGNRGPTPGNLGDILAIRSVDGGANWSQPVPLNSTGPSGDNYSHSITTDRDGNSVAVWEYYDPLGETDDDSDLVVARSVDFGASWSTPQLLNSTANTDANQDDFPQIATDTRGEWLVVWQSSEPFAKPGHDREILAAHFGLPDCNQNLIGDPLETAAGIIPDINNNSVPDFCEVFPAAPNGGCGGGLCGGGMATLSPAALLGALAIRRVRRRHRFRLESDS